MIKIQSFQEYDITTLYCDRLYNEKTVLSSYLQTFCFSLFMLNVIFYILDLFNILSINYAFNGMLILLFLYVLSWHGGVINSYKQYFKNRTQLSGIKRQNKKVINSWKVEFVNSTDRVLLVDLFIAKKYKLLADNEYQIKKEYYVSQHVNHIQSNKFLGFNDEELMFSKNMRNIDINSFIVISLFKNDLEFDMREYEVLKNNFLQNKSFAKYNELLLLKKHRIISDGEYLIKLSGLKIYLRKKRIWFYSNLIKTQIITLMVVGVLLWRYR